ncbi:hypothetical protein KQH82_03830 [bacterium]|nr:hypothetical protein [bacterium]
MISKASIVFAWLVMTYSVAYAELELLNFGEFPVESVEFTEIAEFTGENGNSIKPSRRDTRFVEVKLVCTSNAAGEFALYPKMFSALFRFRGVAQIAPAVAMGTKTIDKFSGQTREYWYNEPDVSIVVEIEAGERIVKYFVFEVPEETGSFVFHGPIALGTIELSK